MKEVGKSLPWVAFWIFMGFVVHSCNRSECERENIKAFVGGAVEAVNEDMENASK